MIDKAHTSIWNTPTRRGRWGGSAGDDEKPNSRGNLPPSLNCIQKAQNLIFFDGQVENERHSTILGQQVIEILKMNPNISLVDDDM